MSCVVAIVLSLLALSCVVYVISLSLFCLRVELFLFVCYTVVDFFSFNFILLILSRVFF